MGVTLGEGALCSTGCSSRDQWLKASSVAGKSPSLKGYLSGTFWFSSQGKRAVGR